MKIEIIYIHIAIVAAVALPYFFFILAAALERRKLKSKFHQEEKELRLDIDQVSAWNFNIMGLDKNLQKLLFVQKWGEEIRVQLIDLEMVKTCVLIPEVRSINKNKRTENLLERVDLVLTLHSGANQVLNLFDFKLSYSQDYELKNAEKWNQIINESLRILKGRPSAA